MRPGLPVRSLRVLFLALLGLQMAGVVGLLVFLTRYPDWRLLGILSLGMILLALGVGLVAVDWLLQSIQSLKVAAQAVAQGEWHPPLRVPRFGEVQELALAFDHMASQLQGSFTELEHLNRALTTSEERWREFLDAIPLGIVVYDRDGQMVFASTEARQLLGLGGLDREDRDSVPPLRLADTFTVYRLDGSGPYPMEALPITQSLRGEQAWADDMVLQRGDQSIPLEMASTPIFDAGGQVEFAVAALQDLSTHRQAQQVLADYNRTLEAMVAQRTHALEQAQITQRIILQAIPDLLLRYNREGVCLDILSAGSVTLLAPPSAQIGRSLTEVLPPAMAAERLHYIHLTLETGQPQLYEYRFETPEGWRHEEARLVSSGEEEVLVIVRDITERKQAEMALRESQTLYRSLTEVLPHGLYRLDRQHRLTFTNPAYLKHIGRTLEDCIGKTAFDLFPHPQAQCYTEDDERVMATGQPMNKVETYVRPDLSDLGYLQVCKTPLYDDDGNVVGMQGVFWDVTELHAANEKLERLATLDGLTQIPNRRRFDEYLQQEWQRMVREQQSLSLILFDVDYFKPYNDHFGHQQGDEGLIAIAQAANRAVKRSADLLARYGGEEFGVILPNTNRSGAENVAKAIQRQVAALNLVHPKSQVSDYLTVSMGIASVVPSPEQALEELIAAADAALYQAKRRGRNRYWIRLI